MCGEFADVTAGFVLRSVVIVQKRTRLQVTFEHSSRREEEHLMERMKFCPFSVLFSIQRNTEDVSGMAKH